MTDSDALASRIAQADDAASTNPSAPRAVAVWLLICCAMLFAMIVIGGVTRLTHSGLSIVEWQPIVGAIPPLDEAQWEESFARYRQTPEFRLRNHDMKLAGFKGSFNAHGFLRYRIRVRPNLFSGSTIYSRAFFLFRWWPTSSN